MNSDSSFPILLSCCLCLLCILVLAIVVTVIVMVMRKRKSDTPEIVPPSGSFIPREGSAPAAVETPIAPPVEEPVEPSAAQTIVSSGPLVEPAPDEKAENPFKPGSVAAASFDVDFDVRELYMVGFTEAEMHKFKKEEIQAVLDGKYSLADLRRSYQD